MSAALLALLVGCADPPVASPPAASAPVDPHLPLSQARLLRRMSLDLRGTLPTLAELDALAGGESTLDELRDAYLGDPAFEERFVHILAKSYRTQVDDFLVRYDKYPSLAVDPTVEYAFERAVGDEPLRLAARVAATDLPWSTIVTADWSMANEITGPLWPVDYPEGGTGWQEVRYTDGRPAAGILATNGLWWRYFTTVSNYNRGRVAALSRLLLCEDYLAREVTVQGFTDTTDVEDNLRGNPYCLGCHASIDPIAATLFGFWPANEYNIDEIQRYHPEREPLGPYLLDVEPSWFGTPVTSLADLGQHVAADPRFASCTVETAASLLWQRDVVPGDAAALAEVRAAYLADPRMKTVLRAVTDGGRYRAGNLADDASEEQRATEVLIRQLDAPLLASVLEDLSGFTWTWEGFEQLRSDTYGYRVLGGGVDGIFQTRSLSSPNVTWLLLMRRVAESAAVAAVNDELVGTAERRVFTHVSLADQPGDGPFTEELTALHRRLYGDAPEAAWQADVEALWSAAAADADPAEAWRTTLAALLQDPAFVSY
jgi:hypothetical protein